MKFAAPIFWHTSKSAKEIETTLRMESNKPLDMTAALRQHEDGGGVTLPAGYLVLIARP